jgi:glucosamine kinase
VLLASRRVETSGGISVAHRLAGHARRGIMTDRMHFVIGLDGGGSGCRVAVCAQDGQVLASATSGAANYTSEPDLTVAHICEALGKVSASLGMSHDRLLEAPAHLGVAGIVTQADAQTLARRLPLKRCRISDDQLTSTIGALGDRDGALVGVGTGSFVALKRGDMVRSLGGWGLALGDQGSGAWLGRSALQRCALVADGLAPMSAMIASLLGQFDDDRGQMISFARTASPADYAGLAPRIFEAAACGDHHARALITEGAGYLDLCLSSLALEKDDVVCVAGGLASDYARWLSEDHRTRLVKIQGTALDGAVRLAWRLADAKDGSLLSGPLQ